MSWGWHDMVGSAGALIIVISYLGLQSGRLNTRQPRYSLFNALGAGLILLSLTQQFNLSAFLIEFFWLLISLYGFSRAIRLRAARLRLLRMKVRRYRARRLKNHS